MYEGGYTWVCISTTRDFVAMVRGAVDSFVLAEVRVVRPKLCLES